MVSLERFHTYLEHLRECQKNSVRLRKLLATRTVGDQKWCQPGTLRVDSTISSRLRSWTDISRILEKLIQGRPIKRKAQDHSAVAQDVGPRIRAGWDLCGLQCWLQVIRRGNSLQVAHVPHSIIQTLFCTLAHIAQHCNTGSAVIHLLHPKPARSAFFESAAAGLLENNIPR